VRRQSAAATALWLDAILKGASIQSQHEAKAVSALRSATALQM
jgi:hypothetical protein